ncbi:MAG: hypothetical protein IKV26_03170 [Paludibacteraceae bacterium]|nr:hypothetical protein [Paludibacteraceae bacterium]
MNSKLDQIYTEGIKYSQAQEICRELLIDRISVYNFKNVHIYNIVNNILRSIVFPIEYEIDIEQFVIIRKGYKNLACSLCTVGVVVGILLLTKQCSSDFWSIMSGLLIGLSFLLFKVSKQTEIVKKNKINTNKEVLVRYIDDVYNNLIELDNISRETRTIHNELLFWFQKLHSWSCRKNERFELKKDIEDIMMRFEYEFCEYTPMYADFFDATNANVESITTTVYALMNGDNVILKGKVVLPMG